MIKHIIVLGFTMLGYVKPGVANDVDLSVQVSPSSINVQDGVDIGEFSITITNNGPETAGALANSQFPISINANIINLIDGRYYVEFIRNTNIQQECFFLETAIDPIPPNPPGSIYSFFIPELAPQASITCYGVFLTNFEGGVRTVDWSANSTFDTDVDASNDQSSLRFIGSVIAVPGLSIFGITVFVLVLLLVATMKLRKRAV